MNISYKKTTLGDLGKIITGKTPSTKNLDYYNSPSIPFITPTDYEEGTRFVKTSRYLSDIARIKFSSNLLPQESIMVTCIGSQMGKVGLNGEECITKQQINSIIPDKQKVDTDYLYYLLLKMESILRRLGEGGGSTMPIINKTDFSNLEISLPPLSEQHRIANILSSFDNKIELLRKENNTLEDIAQSIFKEWFVKAKGPEQIEVSDLIEFNPQLSLKKNQVSWYIEMADLSTNSSSISRIVKRSYTSGSKFQNNDILFARVTPCLENGKTGIVKGLDSEDIAWGSTEFIVMRGKDSISYPFVYCLARENQFRQFAQKEMIGTSGRQRVPVNKLQRYLITKPSIEKLNSFNQISLSIFEDIEKNSREAEILIKMKNNLLKKLI